MTLYIRDNTIRNCGFMFDITTEANIREQHNLIEHITPPGGTSYKGVDESGLRAVDTGKITIRAWTAMSEVAVSILQNMTTDPQSLCFDMTLPHMRLIGQNAADGTIAYKPFRTENGSEADIYSGGVTLKSSIYLDEIVPSVRIYAKYNRKAKFWDDKKYLFYPLTKISKPFQTFAPIILQPYGHDEEEARALTEVFATMIINKEPIFLQNAQNSMFKQLNLGITTKTTESGWDQYTSILVVDKGVGPTYELDNKTGVTFRGVRDVRGKAFGDLIQNPQPGPDQDVTDAAREWSVNCNYIVDTTTDIKLRITFNDQGVTP